MKFLELSQDQRERLEDGLCPNCLGSDGGAHELIVDETGIAYCPFCGWDDSHIDYEGDVVEGEYVVRCPNCDGELTVGHPEWLAAAPGVREQDPELSLIVYCGGCGIAYVRETMEPFARKIEKVDPKEIVKQMGWVV